MPRVIDYSKWDKLECSSSEEEEEEITLSTEQQGKWICTCPNKDSGKPSLSEGKKAPAEGGDSIALKKKLKKA